MPQQEMHRDVNFVRGLWREGEREREKEEEERERELVHGWRVSVGGWELVEVGGSRWLDG